MLRTRIITALVLGVILLAALFLLPAAGWMTFVAAVVAIAAWEWAGFARLGHAGRIVFLAIVVATLAAALTWTGLAAGEPHSSNLRLVYACAAGMWLVAVPWWLRTLPRDPPIWLVSAAGLVALVCTGLAIVDLRAIGVGPLLAVMSIAWVADVTAYFVGKGFGRHKLAPAISPGKTIEGAVGALAGVAIYAFGMLSTFALVAAPLALAVLATILLGAISIVGDLFESALKRQAGLKDSGRILPGHGGVLDRIDALLPILPLAALLLPRA